MNDPKNPKNPPPDDFSKTTPYFRVPKNEQPEQSGDYTSDWEKTNYIFNPSPPRQTPPVSDDEWGKTAVNINVPRANQDDDFGKTFMPGQMPQSPQTPKSDWDLTQANININPNDFGGSRGQQQQQQNEYGATMPFIQLPESERARLRSDLAQNASQTTPEQDNNNKKKGTPAWMWFAGVGTVFLLLLVTLVGAYLIFSKRYGYDVVVKGAQPNSDVFVDKTRWGTTSADGSIKLSGLSAGKHNLEITHPKFTYETETVDGEDGGKVVEVVAKSKPKETPPPPPPADCDNFKKGEFEKAAKCANEALDKLGDNPSVQDLLRAMNLYIINFDVNKFDIKPKDSEFLQKAAGYMKKLPPDVKIEVGGHTDSDGPPAKNQVLSENRAKAVRDALVGFGVKTDMLEMRGYGATRPKPGNTNANPDEKFQNRRIEYTAIIR